MYNHLIFPFTPESEKRPAWRSAYEIKVAALEHEKRRHQWMQEYIGLAKPQPTHLREQRTGLASLLALPMRLFSNLMG
ncbi:MAG: hypothetical protein N2117_05470 [Anaerolineales bacterium]|nr:hypothetical protein [Anaerolineales bacterium]MCX7754680.1 hypothetical protein [Anaerolineales bacterium]MDW8279401.1 hypothetical protein [Anaerolineales bacterium]